MNPLFALMFLAVAIALLVSYVASRPRGRQLRSLINVAEGFQPAIRTLYADAAIATRGLLLKKGTDATHVAVCDAADIPIGAARDTAAAAEDALAVAMLGLHHCGELGVASAAIATDVFLVPADGGKLRTLPVAAGTYYIVGKSTKAAAADGDPVEYVPCFPIQRVVA